MLLFLKVVRPTLAVLFPPFITYQLPQQCCLREYLRTQWLSTVNIYGAHGQAELLSAALCWVALRPVFLFYLEPMNFPGMFFSLWLSEALRRAEEIWDSVSLNSELALFSSVHSPWPTEVLKPKLSSVRGRYASSRNYNITVL